MSGFQDNVSCEQEETDTRVVEVVQLRNLGNEFYRRGEFDEAVRLWFKSLKESLKGSCCLGVAAFNENQLTCRLNLSMAYLKQQNWVEAKEQADLVLEQQPRNVKALLRLACAYEGLQEWSQCHKVMGIILTCLDELSMEKTADHTAVDSDNDTSLAIYMCGLDPENVKSILADMCKRIRLDKLRYKRDQAKMLRSICPKMIKGNHCTSTTSCVSATPECPSGEPLSSPAQVSLVHDPEAFVQWTYCTPHPEQRSHDTLKDTELPKEPLLSMFADRVFRDDLTTVDAGLDDVHHDIWTCAHPKASLANRQAQALCLPLSTAYAVMQLLRTDCLRCDTVGSPPFRTVQQHKEETQTAKKDLMSVVGQKKSLTMWVIGARGDVEVHSHWTSLLRRIPSIDHLRLVFIGFCDANDRYSTSLREGVLSRPLTQKRFLVDHQQLTYYLFKGLLQLFLENTIGVSVVFGARERTQSDRRLTFNAVLHALPTQGVHCVSCLCSTLFLLNNRVKPDGSTEFAPDSTLLVTMDNKQTPLCGIFPCSVGFSPSQLAYTYHELLVRETREQQLRCRTGMWCYALGQFSHVLQMFSDALTHDAHEFHPDLLCIFQPGLEQYKQSWTPAFQQLLASRIPIVLTESCTVDKLLRDVDTLCSSFNDITVSWAVEAHSNPYGIPYVMKDSAVAQECVPAKPTCAYKDAPPYKEHGVIGCLIGSTSSNAPLREGDS